MISNLHRISPRDNAHYFFGYYDIPVYSADNKLHLAHRVDFWKRWPQAEDEAQIGVIERDRSTFTPLATTTAWNFQQGAMLQWFPGSPPSEIIFNLREGNNYRSCILDIHSGKKRIYPMPIANVDRQGRYALSINFSRLFDFRPGYGYAGIPDPHFNNPHPENDGIYLQDFRDGSTKLILSLQQIWEFTRQWLPANSDKLLINHITLNPSGTRFVALIRYLPIQGRLGTIVLTADINGTNLRTMRKEYAIASHYFWKNDEELLIYAVGDRGVQLYEWNERTGSEHLIDSEFFTADGHCSYSPNGKYILYDSYPDRKNLQHLYLYEPALRKGYCLEKLYSSSGDIEVRCDLHPRWNLAGNLISLDSTHEGTRHIYETDLQTRL